MTPLRIGLITDIHGHKASWDGQRKKLAAAVETFRRCGVDCIVELGDRIKEASREDDADMMRGIRAALLEAGTPVYHLFGNHDVIYLPKQEQNELLDKQGDYEMVVRSGCRLILLDSTEGVSGGPISQEQLTWLQQAIEEASPSETVLVFCHHPLDVPDVTGHSYFESRPREAAAANAEEVRGILARTGRVAAVFHGHLHRWQESRWDGIPYVTLPSFTDDEDERFPSGGFAIVEVPPAPGPVTWQLLPAPDV